MKLGLGCSIVFAVMAAAGAARAGEPVERRLYSDAIDASSFLWGDWNRFVENYHPNYLGDDDPKTAWVEGVPGSGAGQWVRLQVTPLDGTTRVRLKIRNGYQKSKELFAANARAKDVVVRLLPSRAEIKATLTDSDGWQEVIVTQPVGALRAIELRVGSVYEGSKYQDLCISDVAVYASSTTADNPTFEKSKKKSLLAWRAGRIAAAKAWSSAGVALPLHASYQVTSTEGQVDCDNCDLAGMLAAAAADPAWKPWQEAIAVGQQTVAELDRLPTVQVAPRAKTALPVADGFERPDLGQVAGFEGPWFSDRALRLPQDGRAAFLDTANLRALDVKGSKTPTQFVDTVDKRCKKSVTWAKRLPASGGPATLRALVIGRCGRVEGREGTYPSAALELLVFGADGRLALVVNPGAIDGYRWAGGERPLVAGGRALLAQGVRLEASPAAAP